MQKHLQLLPRLAHTHPHLCSFSVSPQLQPPLPYSLIRKTSAVAPLQEHLLLLRSLAQALPARFPDLQLLLDSDPEVDFFHNIAHLQLHRRTRALQRLAKVGWRQQANRD